VVGRWPDPCLGLSIFASRRPMMSTSLSDSPAREESTAHDAMQMATSGRAQKPTSSNLVQVGNSALRVRSIPARSMATIGRGAALAVAVLRYSVVDTVKLRLPVGEFLVQAWLLLTVTVIPAVLMAITFGAMVSVVSSGLVNQVGASSLLGAASGAGVVRQGAPITAGLLMGGAAASAIASDFGARAIREELDALLVMGVNPVRRLVVGSAD
jgi:phospholipid/cholesterol/gamma-HCH transport system permease protein